MNVLLTGGAGFIGSHTAVALLEAGHQLTILDNFSNSSFAVLTRLRELTGKSLKGVEGDIRNLSLVEDLLRSQKIDAVIHLAGLKAVGESVSDPLRYYDNNVSGTTTLLLGMQRAGVKKIVFSSSATVYRGSQEGLFNEDSPLEPVNPYGRSKLMIELILRDYVATNSFEALVLRYFNPVGAHSSGRIGESPLGVPNNLMPFVAQVAVGRRKELAVFGQDWPTPDGTGIRDYIHVMDLARGHVAALERLEQGGRFDVFNLGTGQGHSVLEVIQAFEKASGKPLPYHFAARRPGDQAVCCARVEKARQVLGFETQAGLEEMAADAWRFQMLNPQGIV
ncbi:MAG: UDP-glucose 4-epimerase GalE [Polyangiaceae bacterium]|nr:UDP-glucose 4-epimerase GalE [Polyangiaceae bacterium]